EEKPGTLPQGPATNIMKALCGAQSPGSPVCAGFAHDGVEAPWPVTSLLDHPAKRLGPTGLTKGGSQCAFVHSPLSPPSPLCPQSHCAEFVRMAWRLQLSREHVQPEAELSRPQAGSCAGG